MPKLSYLRLLLLVTLLAPPPAAAAEARTSEEAMVQAALLHRTRDTEGAVAVLLERLAERPGDVPLRLEAGKYLSYLRRFDEARLHYELVLAREPRNLAAQVGMAKIMSWQGDQQQAIALYDDILVRRPTLYDAQVGKAFALLWSGRGEQARPLLEAASRRNPHDADVAAALAELPRRVAMQEQLSAEAANGSATPATAMSKTAPPRQSATAAAPRGRKQGKQPSAAAKPVTAPEAATLPERLRDAGFASTSAATLAAIPPPAWYAAGAFFLLVGGRRVARNVRLRRRPAPLPGVRRRPILLARSSADLQAAPAPPPPTPETAPMPAPYKEAPPVAIIIGDEPAVMELERRILRSLGAEVFVMPRWAEARDIIQSHPPDLLLVNDISADRATSTAICSWLRAHHPSGCRHVLLAQSRMDEETERFVRHGATSLPHPFRAADLAAVATPLLRRAGARRP